MLLGVDVGGTFTDAVLFDGRTLHTAKAPTTPDDQSRGVLAAVDEALRRADRGPEQVQAFAHGMTEPLVMRSSGGVAPAAEAAEAGAWSVLSGPAGGAVGAGLLATLSADGNVVGLDMGGTSCDVCVVEDGRVQRTDSREIGGRVIQLPMVDVHTVGAGGGSIGWRDAGGALRVGPQSAGADPGPACYGKGGTEPTVTDANVIVGHLPPQLLGGQIQLAR